MNPIKVLFIATSNDQMGDTRIITGVWLEELAAPYYIFKDAGAELTIASPRGGPVPLDPKSESIMLATQKTKRFLTDPEAIDFLSQSVLLQNIKADEFDVVFLPGGHGMMWDIADNEKVEELLQNFYRQNKPMGFIGEAIVALVSLKNKQGELWVKGIQLTGASNTEEESARLAGILPFLPETTMHSLGALYSKGPDYTSYVVASEHIITGQNPASSAEVAKQIIALIEKTEDTRLRHPAVDKIM